MTDQPQTTTREQRLEVALGRIIEEATRIRMLPPTDAFSDGLREGWSAARSIAMDALS